MIFGKVKLPTHTHTHIYPDRGYILTSSMELNLTVDKLHIINYMHIFKPKVIKHYYII